MVDWNWQVRARAHRCLKPLKRYHDLTQPSVAHAPWIDAVTLQDNEERIGVYQNEPDTPREYVLITTHGVNSVVEANMACVAYEEIVAIEPLTDKEHADRLRLHLVDGSIAEISIRGADGKLRDAFEFLRFLRRVAALREGHVSDAADVSLASPTRVAS